MKLWSDSLRDGDAIPSEVAFARIDATLHVALAPYRNPRLAWRDAPEDTRSFVVPSHDFYAREVPDDVNHPGREVPTSFARVDFFHWVHVDLPPTAVSVAVGEFWDQVVPEGKPGPGTRHGARHGARHGLNGYTARFARDHDMAGEYSGHDGPRPSWNDALIHRDPFAVHALDVERMPIEGRFTGARALVAMQQHVLARASVTGRCTLNPRLAGSVPPAA